MKINWRGLLDNLQIPWADRGPNTSPGNVNIKCPFCHDDPSKHLSISENKAAFYCYRNPQRHSGTNLNRLFYALHVSEQDSRDLLNYYRKDEESDSRGDRKGEGTDLDRTWGSFSNVSVSISFSRYLMDRGFPSPQETARIFDLRFAEQGEWAGRILIPFKDINGKLISWSGRAVRKSLEPRYKMPYLKERLSPIYIPRFPTKRLVIVEGPIDALKGSIACQGAEFSFVALAGLGLNQHKLHHLSKLSAYIDHAFFAPDKSVTAATWLPILYELRQVFPNIIRLTLPGNYGDPGKMPLETFIPWLRNE